MSECPLSPVHKKIDDLSDSELKWADLEKGDKLKR